MFPALECSAVIRGILFFLPQISFLSKFIIFYLNAELYQPPPWVFTTTTDGSINFPAGITCLHSMCFITWWDDQEMVCPSSVTQRPVSNSFQEFFFPTTLFDGWIAVQEVNCIQPGVDLYSFSRSGCKYKFSAICISHWLWGDFQKWWKFFDKKIS